MSVPGVLVGVDYAQGEKRGSGERGKVGPRRGSDWRARAALCPHARRAGEGERGGADSVA